MHKSDLLKIGGVATLIILIGTLGIVINQQTQDQPTAISASSNQPPATSETEPTANQPATGPLEQDPIEDELFDPYPKGDETGEELAAAFGCGWWAKPIVGETITELADRMKPIITQTMYDEILKLRNPDNDTTTTIEAIPGVITTEETTIAANGTQTTQYNVACNTTELDTENKPTGQQAQTAQVVITQTPDGQTYVSEAVLAGLPLP